MARPVAGDVFATALILLAVFVVAVIACTTLLDGYRRLRTLTDRSETDPPDAGDEPTYDLAA